MAKTREQKEQMLADYNKLLKDADGAIIVSPKGMDADTISNLKKEINDMGGTYMVVKNTLFKIALKENDMPEFQTFESGAHAVLFVPENIADAAKLLRKFMKENKDKLEIKGGIIDGSEISIEQVEALADMPSLEESIAMIAGILTQNVAGVANVLEDSVRSVAIIINEAFKE